MIDSNQLARIVLDERAAAAATGRVGIMQNDRRVGLADHVGDATVIKRQAQPACVTDDPDIQSTKGLWIRRLVDQGQAGTIRRASGFDDGQISFLIDA